MLTDPDLPTGSDRIHAGDQRARPATRAHDAVINVQGDMPMLDPAAIRLALAALADPETDIATLAAVIVDPAGAARHQRQQGGGRVRRSGPAGAARSISRRRRSRGATGRITSISGSTPIAAPRSTASSRLPRGVLEQRERLEQLRALEAGMRIAVSLIDPVPLGSGRYPGRSRARPRADAQPLTDADARALTEH